jgi:hypothetical protein
MYGCGTIIKEIVKREINQKMFSYLFPAGDMRLF